MEGNELFNPFFPNGDCRRRCRTTFTSATTSGTTRRWRPSTWTACWASGAPCRSAGAGSTSRPTSTSWPSTTSSRPSSSAPRATSASTVSAHFVPDMITHSQEVSFTPFLHFRSVQLLLRHQPRLLRLARHERGQHGRFSSTKGKSRTTDEPLCPEGCPLLLLKFRK